MSANQYFTPVKEIKSNRVCITKILQDFLKSPHDIVMLNDDIVFHYKTPEACRRNFYSIMVREGLRSKLKICVRSCNVYISKIKEDS